MSKVKKAFYKFRKTFWEYPDNVFFGKKSWFKSFKSVYSQNIPYSHFISITLVLTLFILFGFANLHTVLSVKTSVLIEGSIMGVDKTGKTAELTRINPLINSNIQLEKDLSELIYEPLIRVDNNGTPTSVIAEYSILQNGSSYRFKLKPDLKWHDGKPVTVDDVVKTVELLRSLNTNEQTTSLFTKVANKIEIQTSNTDKRVFEFLVKDNQVIPGFFEAISFKILPAHLIDDINPNNIMLSDPYINRNPVGTGPYKLIYAKGNLVKLQLNTDYWGELPSIEEIHFKLFPNETLAIDALKTGQLHGLTGINIESVAPLRKYKQIDILKSNPIGNQYWGLYFNMGVNGPSTLKNKLIRQAISSSINREKLIEEMYGFAELANSPIHSNSFAYADAYKYTYDLTRADELFRKAGFEIDTDGVRTNAEGVKLSYKLTVIKNVDRENIAKIIKEDLAKVGVKIEIETIDTESAVNDRIIPRIYDILLYGIQTLIDPDRYELFHSSQINAPGLNISSYASEEKRTQIVDGKTMRLPAVDDDLDDARRIIDENARKKKYDDFQKIFAEEVPVLILFNPNELYLVNNRVKNVILDDINSIEQRFTHISQWEIDTQEVFLTR